jgi:hypothetical protein
MAAASLNMPLLHNQSWIAKRKLQLDGVVRLKTPHPFREDWLQQRTDGAHQTHAGLVRRQLIPT